MSLELLRLFRQPIYWPSYKVSSMSVDARAASPRKAPPHLVLVCSSGGTSCSEGPGGGQLRCSADGTTLCHFPSPVADPVTLCKLDAENVDDQRHCDPPEQ